MKRAAIYLRVSTQDQTTSNQEHELRQAAERAGWQVAKVYKDHAITTSNWRLVASPAQCIERRSSIAALSAADAVILVDLRYLPTGPFCRLA